MKLNELLIGIEVLDSTADMNLEIADISYDSRKTKPRDLFVAVTGFETDGHMFIADAVKKGAAAVLCEQKPDTDIAYILVKSSRKALALISRNYFGDPAKGLCMIGVTGTNGKTTVTYLMKTVLERALGAKVGLIGTNQNLIGDQAMETERTTPEAYDLQKLLYQMAGAGCTHVVMEVSSHALALSRVEGIHFQIGIFTNLTQDHLDFHKTMEDYLKAKALLFSMCDIGIINLDDKAAPELVQLAKCKVVTYSLEKNEADLVAKNIQLKAEKVEYEALSLMNIQRMELNIPGSFSVYNSMAVVAAAMSLGIGLEDISAALKTASGVKGRAEVVPLDTDYTMLIDYAHTPDGLENILKAVRGFAKGRVVTLFGCGGDRDPVKRPIMGEIAAQLSDFLIVTSDNPRTEEPMAIIEDIMPGVRKHKTPHVVIEDRRAAIAYAMDNAQSGDVIVLAGKGHETYQILGKTKVHLDEREIIAEHMRSKG